MVPSGINSLFHTIPLEVLSSVRALKIKQNHQYSSQNCQQKLEHLRPGSEGKGFPETVDRKMKQHCRQGAAVGVIVNPGVNGSIQEDMEHIEPEAPCA